MALAFFTPRSKYHAQNGKFLKKLYTVSYGKAVIILAICFISRANVAPHNA
jgi:hypothetical protein